MTSLRHEDALPPALLTRSNPVGIVTAFAAAYGLAYLVFERAGVGSQGLRDLLGNVAFMPLNIAVAVLNWLASRQMTLDAGVRRALRVCAIGALSVFIGNCISVWYLLVLHSKPTASPADFFYLADSIILLVALLMFPLSRRIRVERWKLILDAAMVLAGGAVLVWYFAIRPTAEAHGDSTSLTLFTYAFPLASGTVRPSAAWSAASWSASSATSPSTWCCWRRVSGARAGPMPSTCSRTSCSSPAPSCTGDGRWRGDGPRPTRNPGPRS